MGLVEPCPTVKSGRFDRFRLTAQGRTRLHPAAKEVEALGAEIIARMGAAEYSELERLLARLEDRLVGLDFAL